MGDSLFSSLPAPSGTGAGPDAKRRRVEEAREAPSSHGDDQGQNSEVGPSSEAGNRAEPVQESPVPAQGDVIASALERIGSHIGHPKKFGKASGLLRQLLQASRHDASGWRLVGCQDVMATGS